MRPHSRPKGRPSDADTPGATVRRRRLLENIQRQSSRMSERELAARVAADDREPAPDPDDEAVRDIHVVLRHVDLPKAEAAGLVSWDASTGTVEPADDAALSETEARQLFADGWDDPEAVSRSERRQAALEVLRESEGALSLDDLAAEVVAHETDSDVAPASGDVDDVGISLHHRHLPGLQAAGLVEYDPAGRTVVYRGPAESGRSSDRD